MGKKAGSKEKQEKSSGPASKKANAAGDFKQLSSTLQELGLTIRPMASDGNCMFRSLADQLHGDTETHMQLRIECVQYMREHKDHFSLFCDGDFDAYLTSVASVRTWGDQLCLLASIRMRKVNALIHQYGDTPSYEIHWSDSMQECLGSTCIQLSRHDGEHYNSVRFISDNTSKPARCLTLRSLRWNKADWDKALKTLSINTGCVDEGRLRKVLLDCDVDIDLATEKLLEGDDEPTECQAEVNAEASEFRPEVSSVDQGEPEQKGRADTHAAPLNKKDKKALKQSGKQQSDHVGSKGEVAGAEEDLDEATKRRLAAKLLVLR